MASADLLRREEEFYSSLFDSAKGDGVRSRSQVIERKIELLEDMATKVSNRRSHRWLNDRLLIELVPRLHVEEIKGLFAPPPWGEELPLSAFCRTSVSEWEAFRSIDMDAEARLMQHMKKSSEKQRAHVDEDELIALNAWRRIDRQTRDSIKRNFLPDLLEIYEERVRAFIEDAGDSNVLVLNVQDPFQRLLLHGVCEFYNVASTTTSSVRDGKPWKSTTIKKRLGTGVPSRITLVSFLRMKKNGSQTSVSEWEAFRTIDMDAEKQRTHVDEDELIALNAWRRIDRQTRDSIKRNFLPDLLEIYEERVRAFIEDGGDSDVLVLNVQDPFQRLLLHGVCEFYNVTSTTTSSVRDGKPWKSTTIKKRLGTGVPSRITLVSFLRMKKNGS
ncbi:hypothetical protein U9M48_034558, partial [Paspalum notatum var. saurae]